MSTVKICALIFQDQGLEGDFSMREAVGFQMVLSEFMQLRWKIKFA